MNNIKKYDEFVNEGLFSNIKKILSSDKPEKEMDNVVKNIIKEISDDFDPSKLDHISRDKGVGNFNYKMKSGDVVWVLGGDMLLINKLDITEDVNKKYLKELFKFLEKSYYEKLDNNIENKKQQKISEKEKGKSELKDKYSKK